MAFKIVRQTKTNKTKGSHSWAPAEFFAGGGKFLVGEVSVLRCQSIRLI